MKALVLITVVLLSIHSHVCDMVADDDWIDPYDMGNFDQSTNTMKGKPKIDGKTTNTKEEERLSKLRSQTEPEVEKAPVANLPSGDNSACSRVVSPCLSLFKQYVKSLLYHIRSIVNMGSEDLNLRVKVTATELEYLERYSNPSSQEKDFHHVHEILSNMVQTATEVSYGDPSTQRLWIENILGMPVEKFFMFSMLAGLLTLAFYTATKFHFSWWKLSVKLTFILFVISVFWQWYELYKKEEAKQHMTIVKEMPEGCRRQEKDQGFMTTIFRSISTTFTFQTDECLKYYEHMLIDPFWRVTPTQALSKTVIRFFVAPARDLGEAIRDFFTGLLKDLPAQLWPLVIGVVAIFSFLLLFMYFGYKVSLPFGLVAVEPGQRADNSAVQRAIAQQNEELEAIKEDQAKQLKAIMDSLKEERLALNQQLENQQRFLALPQVQSQFAALQSGDQASRSFPKAVEASRDMLVSDILEDCRKDGKKICEKKDHNLSDDMSDGFQVLGDDINVTGADSYEEISVSNLETETIGQRDN